ncbi:MAG TPA: hypothetical protein DIS66_02760 [Candidatus Omnitrophica bacterium]|nr:hypothetical protein [Candidatus Omnitrophota bacterium]
MALMLKRVNRPRDLKWYQAGALLYGDWGTSKAYVLGIAFALSGHASWFFLGLMSLLTAAVGVCYVIICRLFPDGGGVYSAAKSRSRVLAMVGAFLLVAGYTVTAAISAIEAFHYLRVPDPELWAVISIVIIGLINWIGPGKVGSFAALIAIAASLSAFVLFFYTVPGLPQVELTMPKGSLLENWSSFVGIVLALSGVEAVANMTGIMQNPVEKTAKKAIFPVLLEVSILTFLLGIAMNAIPGLEIGNHAEAMMRTIAEHYAGPLYGQVIAVTFGLLLLSAANTAIGALVNIQFSLAKDRELPSVFTQLNRFGMPWLPLAIGTLIPVIVLVVEPNVLGLAELYAVGVVGAIGLNLAFCATNSRLSMKPWEKILLRGSALIMLLVELTICMQKPKALLFAVAIVGGGFLISSLSKRVPVKTPVEEAEGMLNVLTVEEAGELASLYPASTMVALKYMNMNLIEEAVMRATAKGENTVYLSYVDDAPASSVLLDEVEPSPESIHVFSTAQAELEKNGITAIPVWQIGADPGRLIADAAKALSVKTVVIGTTKKSALVNMIRGEVFRALARKLPAEIRLVVTG